MSRRTIALALVLAVAVGIGAGVVASQTTDEFPYEVTVIGEIPLQQDPEDIERIVKSALGETATVLTMIAVPSDKDVKAVEPRAGEPVEGTESNSPVWVVRAEGEFVGSRTPPGVAPVRSPTGYFVIDDETGDILEMGMP